MNRITAWVQAKIKNDQTVEYTSMSLEPGPDTIPIRITTGQWERLNRITCGQMEDIRKMINEIVDEATRHER